MNEHQPVHTAHHVPSSRPKYTTGCIPRAWITNNRKCRYTLIAVLWILAVSTYGAVHVVKDDVIIRQLYVVYTKASDKKLNLNNGLFSNGFNINQTAFPGHKISVCPKVLSDNNIPVSVLENSTLLGLTNMTQIQLDNPQVMPGGTWSPEDCSRPNSVAIVIPYRNRPTHLKSLLTHLHPFLRIQKINYTIYVIEQIDNENFNRGMLMNVGAIESCRDTKVIKVNDSQWVGIDPDVGVISDINTTSTGNSTSSIRANRSDGEVVKPRIQGLGLDGGRHHCIIFHDVDLLPEDLRIMYTCPDHVRHMSISLDKWNYKVKYKDVFGGVTAMTMEAFHKINGFSNRFWGWGGEDDNLLHRVQRHKLPISKYPVSFARYTMMSHKREKGNMPNPKRYDLLRQSRNTRIDDTDGLYDLQYKIISREMRPLYTNIRVSLVRDLQQTTTASTKP